MFRYPVESKRREKLAIFGKTSIGGSTGRRCDSQETVKIRKEEHGGAKKKLKVDQRGRGGKQAAQEAVRKKTIPRVVTKRRERAST